MAKVKGIFQITGTLGEINFYMRKGELIARKAGGGFNGDAIKSNPSMAKVRQNGSEFGRVSRVVKHFKQGISPFLYSNTFTDLHSRLISLFNSIKNDDIVSERGLREFVIGLDSISGRQKMIGLILPEPTPKFLPLSQKVAFDWASHTLHFKASKDELFSFPKSVDAISFQVGVLEMGTAETGCLLTVSEVIYLTREAALPEQVTVPVISTTSERNLAIVSIHHYELVKNELRPILLKNSFTMEVVSVS